MSSVVDICNLALSHLGDSATVSSLDPPEGSAQAQHCALFYPMARNTLLEMHDWGFATVSVKLALRHGEWLGWRYAYAKPNDLIKVISVAQEAAGDQGSFTAIPYAYEADSKGSAIIFCNAPYIVVRYTKLVTDTHQFPPLFTLALSWQLAAMLAGPIIKGGAGAAEAKRCAAVAQQLINQAAVLDANQSQGEAPHQVPWIDGR